MSKVRTRPFDAANYLTDEETIQLYLEESAKDGEVALRHAEATAERARLIHGLTAPTRRAG